MSESDTTITNSSIARSSVSATYARKKRKNVENDLTSDTDRLTPTPTASRANKSHTSYFFVKDPSDNDIAYCIFCVRDPDIDAYPYSRKGGSTSNMSNHLRERHRVTKFNYLEYLDANHEVNYKKTAY